MMISSDKLRGAIDQLEQTVYFEGSVSKDKQISQIVGSLKHKLRGECAFKMGLKHLFDL